VKLPTPSQAAVAYTVEHSVEARGKQVRFLPAAPDNIGQGRRKAYRRELPRPKSVGAFHLTRTVFCETIVQ
jgi:hypothetical protein